MALSRLAEYFAAEINNHDWSDAPFRADRAGHSREHDGRHATSEVLRPDQAEVVKVNVVWVVGQVLAYLDPNFDIHEFGEAAGVAQRFLRTKHGGRSGVMTAGLRGSDGKYDVPGTYER